MLTVVSELMKLTRPLLNISATASNTGPVSSEGKGTLALIMSDPFTRLRLTLTDPKDTWQPRPVAPSANKQEIPTDEKFVSSTTTDCNPLVATVRESNKTVGTLHRNKMFYVHTAITYYIILYLRIYVHVGTTSETKS